MHSPMDSLPLVTMMGCTSTHSTAPPSLPCSKVHMKMGDAVSALTALQMAQAVQARILALARRDGGASAAASLESERFAAAGACPRAPPPLLLPAHTPACFRCRRAVHGGRGGARGFDAPRGRQGARGLPRRARALRDARAGAAGALLLGARWHCCCRRWVSRSCTRPSFPSTHKRTTLPSLASYCCCCRRSRSCTCGAARWRTAAPCARRSRASTRTTRRPW